MSGPVFRVLSLVTLFFLSACTATQPGQVLSVVAEKKLGAEREPDFIRSRGGIHDDAATLAYLQELTDRLAALAVVPEGYGPLKVRILDTNIPSAYTLAGGDIYLTRGMIAMVNDEAQLAGVIAHEIGHVAARHVARGIAANERLIADIIRQKDLSLRDAGTRSSQVSIIERELEGRVSEITSFSREAELEADRLAIRILRAGGYGTSGFGALLKRLDMWRQLRDRRLGIDVSRIAEIQARSGYPETAERVAALGPLEARPADPVRQARLMGVIDGLPADDRFFGGYVRQGVFWHEGNGFAFDIPADVFTDHGNFMQLVFASGLIGVRVDRADGMTLDALVDQLAATKLKLRNPVRKTINGLPAIVVRAMRREKGEDLSATVTAVDVGEGIVSFVVAGKAGDTARLLPVYREVSNSIRRIRPGEAPGRRQYAARRVQAGDTVASLASEGVFDGDAEAALRLLNGFGDSDGPPDSDWVKLVRQVAGGGT